MWEEHIKGKYDYALTDTFMGFHCGNTPACKLCADRAVKYQLIQHRLLEPQGSDPDFTRGTLEADIAPGDVTFYRLQCDSDGNLRSYIAQGEVLPVKTGSFGGMGSFNLGLRLVRNAAPGVGTVNSNEAQREDNSGGKILIAYFSWGGNTRGVAEEIQRQTGADLFEITLVDPYSADYNTVLEQAQHDQNIQARPELADHVENMEDYDIVMLGYPNWWASIPMPVASFLEEYDFSGKTILPFCSHGGGRFGQSLTAIAKLAPDAVLGAGLSIHYSGGGSLSQDVAEWLEQTIH